MELDGGEWTYRESNGVKGDYMEERGIKWILQTLQILRGVYHVMGPFDEELGFQLCSFSEWSLVTGHNEHINVSKYACLPPKYVCSSGCLFVRPSVHASIHPTSRELRSGVIDQFFKYIVGTFCTAGTFPQ